MQLDKTRIAIRERSYLDLLDLSLHVIRALGRPLFVAFAIGVLPMLVLNGWLLADSLDLDADGEPPAAYILWMLVLVFLEAPAALAPTTLYLGQVVFTERPRPRQILRHFLGSLPQLLLLQGLLRFIFFAWPFLNYVILLERNPLWPRDARQKSTLSRNSTLHGSQHTELLARGLFSLLLGTLLFLSIWLSFYAASYVLLADSEWGRSMYTVMYPAALWLVLGFFAVARFLAYLDLRIRREGWEVELILKAEGARLERQWS